MLFFGISFNAFASALMKYAGRGVVGDSFSGYLWSLLTNLPLIGSIVLYFLSFVLYFLALQRLPLNVAHPVMTSGAIVIVSLFSFFVFQENFSVFKWIGLLLIILGVWLVAISS